MAKSSVPSIYIVVLEDGDYDDEWTLQGQSWQTVFFDELALRDRSMKVTQWYIALNRGVSKVL